jgi:hypothetical protein
MDYVSKVPGAVPPGKVLVHNVMPRRSNQPLGRDGFRAWLAEPADRWERCACGWAPGLPEHYRTKRGP